MNGRRQRSASLPDVRHLQVENFPIDSRDLFEIDLTSVEQSRDPRIRIPSRDSSLNFQSSKETLSSGIKSSLDESESGHVGGHCYTSRDDQMMSTNHHRYPSDLYSEGEIGSKNGLAKFKEIIHASSLKRYFILSPVQAQVCPQDSSVPKKVQTALIFTKSLKSFQNITKTI